MDRRQRRFLGKLKRQERELPQWVPTEYRSISQGEVRIFVAGRKAMGFTPTQVKGQLVMEGATNEQIATAIEQPWWIDVRTGAVID